MAVQSAPIDCEGNTFAACTREMGNYFSGQPNANSKNSYCTGYQVRGTLCMRFLRGYGTLEILENKAFVHISDNVSASSEPE